MQEYKPDKEIILLDLKGRKKRESVSVAGRKGIKWFFRCLRHKSKLFQKAHLYFTIKIAAKRYFVTRLVDVDAIIFAGGGIIECEHYNCHLYLDLITRIAEEKGIRILYNAVGFNGHYQDIFSYRLLSNCLKNEMVRYISVRENAAEMEKYISAKVDLVCDPACWSAEAFHMEKNKASCVIGIGFIRPEIFREFGYQVTFRELDELYYAVLLMLKAEGYHYSFFTNGVEADYQFGMAFFKNHPDLGDPLIYVPRQPVELLQILSQYRAVFCCRMHAAICSYSLDIPSVSLCWNEKLLHFYQNIGYAERCIQPSEANAEKIYGELTQCFREGSYEKWGRDAFRNSLKESIERYLPLIGA